MAISYTQKAKRIVCACPQCGSTQYIDLTKYDIEELQNDDADRSMGRSTIYEVTVDEDLPCGHHIDARILAEEYPENCLSEPWSEPMGIFKTIHGCFEVD